MNQKQISSYAAESAVREFAEGEKVVAKNYTESSKWKIGILINRDGTLNYSLKVGNEVWKYHADQLRKCEQAIEPEPEILLKVPSMKNENLRRPETNATSKVLDLTSPFDSVTVNLPLSSETVQVPDLKPEANQNQPKPLLRRSTRIREPKDSVYNFKFCF